MSAPDLSTVRRLSDAFTGVLREWLTEDQFAEMRSKNVAYVVEDASVCASHDYCDANMAMAEAFEKVVGREMALGEETPEAASAQEIDLKLVNAAWDDAKVRHLCAPYVYVLTGYDASFHDDKVEGQVETLLQPGAVFSKLSSAMEAAQDDLGALYPEGQTNELRWERDAYVGDMIQHWEATDEASGSVFRITVKEVK